MTNNHILRRLRYTFEFDNSKVIALFGLGGQSVTRAQTSDWLKKEDNDVQPDVVSSLAREPRS